MRHAQSATRSLLLEPDIQSRRQLFGAGDAGHDGGVIRKTGKTEDLRDSVRKFLLNPKPEADFSHISGLLDVMHSGESVSVTVEDCTDEKRDQLKLFSQNGFTETALNLDEIFEAYVIGNKGQQLAAG